MCTHDVVMKSLAGKFAPTGEVAKSPFGPEDEIGMLNLANDAARRSILRHIDPGKTFDISVDHFIGMPSWTAAGDQPFQIWMTHTPNGTIVDGSPGRDKAENSSVAYSGDAISMYTHTGTHIDALNHFGRNGKIWNGFVAADHLASRHWTKGGADKHPPIIGRGILLDIPALLGIDELPASYQIGAADLQAALTHQRTELRFGDVVLIRTGRMRAWPDRERYLYASPGLNLDGATFLARAGAMLVGADNASLEYTPHPLEEHWNPVHCFMLSEAGIPLLEVADLEALSAERLYEFAFVAAGLKLRGATGTPVRPLIFPLLD